MTLKEQIRGDSFMSIPNSIAKRLDINASDKMVYLFLLDSIGDKDHGWWGPKQIGQHIGLSADTVSRSLKKLATRGFIEVYHRYRECGNGQTSNGYRLIWPAPEGPQVAPRLSQPAPTLPQPAPTAACTSILPQAAPDTTAACTSILPQAAIQTKEENQGIEPRNFNQGTLSEGEQQTFKQRFKHLLQLWKPALTPEVIEVGKLLQAQEKELGVNINPEALVFLKRKYAFKDLPTKNCTGYVWQKKKGYDEGDLEAIYQAYPRHVAKRSALKAIESALKRLIACDTHKDSADPAGDALDFLLSQTTLFAASHAGQQGKFTPHPATWFNRGSYIDDPSEWNKSTDKCGGIARVDVAPDDECGTITNADLLKDT